MTLLAEYIDSTKIDFTIITETWLQDNEIDKGWVSRTCLNNSNYKISTENHETGKGGGIALVMSEEYYVKKLDKTTTFDSFEHVIWINKDKEQGIHTSRHLSSTTRCSTGNNKQQLPSLNSQKS